jgi:hypothetical protein
LKWNFTTNLSATLVSFRAVRATLDRNHLCEQEVAGLIKELL